MAKVRIGTRLAVALLLVAAASCSGEPSGGGDTAGTATFCATVRPRVAAYLDSAAAAGSFDDPRYGGTIVVGSVAEMAGGMNSAISADYTGTQYQQFVLFTTLVQYDEAITPQPYLARSWEMDEQAGRLVFHLRDDVYWHDGERTDAHDVAFTYRTVTHPETGFPNPAFWDMYVGGADAVEVVDDSTVAFRVRPHADYLDAWRATAILPEHLLGEVPPSQLAAHPFNSGCPVGNGPYAFEEHRLNDRWVFRANPGFPQEFGGRPFPDRLVHRVIPEQTTLLTELLTGGIHVFAGAQPDQAAAIAADPAVDLMSFRHRETAFIAWNSRRPQLEDVRVRRALTLGTDRSRIVQAVLQGYGEVANSTIPPTAWQYDATVLPDTPHDPAAARALLEEAGWTDRDGDGVRENASGTPLAISLKYNQGSRQRQSIAELMQAQLAEIGVDVRIEVVEAVTLSQQLFSTARDFDGVVFSWIQEFRLDDRDLFDSRRIDGPWAMAGTQNPEMDRLLDTLQTIVDHSEAKPVWDEYQRVQAAEHPYTFLYFVQRITGARKSVRGLTVDPRGEWVSARSWWLDPDAR